MQCSGVLPVSSAAFAPRGFARTAPTRMCAGLSAKVGLPGLAGLSRKATVAPRRAIRASAAPIAVASLDNAGDALSASVSNLSQQVFGTDVVAHGTNLMYDLAAALTAADFPDLDEATATELAKNKSGWLAPLSNFMEGTLKVLDGGLESMNVPYSYGYAIILLTVIIKALTLPLSKKQVESTMAMQQLQPKIKDLQAKFAGDQERLQMETAALYKTAGVNPLAGCLPTFATLPVWIGLYRALTNVADEGLLKGEGFYWIPDLGGPTNTADRIAGAGMAWLFPLVDGAPPMGWTYALSYIALPVALVISQIVTTKIMQPPNQSEEQQSANAILKFLPFMIGFFALSVPSGLTLYWFTNNILTTAQQVYLKKTITVDINMPEGGAPVRVDYATGKTVADTRGDKFAKLKKEEEAAKAARASATAATSEFASLDSMLGGNKGGDAPPVMVAEVKDIPAPPPVSAAVGSEMPSMPGAPPSAAAAAAAAAPAAAAAKKEEAPAAKGRKKLSRRERRKKSRGRN